MPQEPGLKRSVLSSLLSLVIAVALFLKSNRPSVTISHHVWVTIEYIVQTRAAVTVEQGVIMLHCQACTETVTG